MVDRVLLPVDDSPGSTAAVEHALSVYPDASFVLLHVVDPRLWISTDEYGEVYYAEETQDAVVDEADDLLAAARKTVEAAGRPVETVRVLGRPATEIVAYAGENDVDAIVMGSHGRRGLDRVLLGSVAERVVRRASVPVTVVH